MKKTVILLGYFAGVLFVLANGLLMLLSPRKFAAFHGRWTRTTDFINPGREHTPGEASSLRLVGGALTAVALVMILLPLSWIRTSDWTPAPYTLHGRLNQDWAQWPLVAITACMLGFGALMVVKPGRVFSLLRMPGWRPAIVPPLAGLSFVRVLGLLVMLFCLVVLRRLLGA